MGFFDKLFGGKAKDENTSKFTNQSKTILTPLQGKVLTSLTRLLHRAFWAPAAALSPPVIPCTLPLTAL